MFDIIENASLIEKAHSLGIKQVSIQKNPNSEVKITEISNRNKINKDLINSCDLILFKPKNPNFITDLVDKRIDIIHPNWMDLKVNIKLANALKRGDFALEFPVSLLYDKINTYLLSNILRCFKLLSKKRIWILFTTRASNEDMLLDPKSLASIGVMLGLSPDHAQWCVNKLPEILLNRSKESRASVCAGVKEIK